MKPDVRDLLAELDAEFSRKAKPKVNGRPRASATPQAPHKALNRVYHQRTNTGDYRDEVAYANATARSWAEEPGWRPVATVHRLHHQRCRTCLGTVSYIANEFTRFRNDRLRLQIDAPETGHRDEFGFDLPQIVTEYSNEVEYCAGCVLRSRRVNDLADALVEAACRPVQRPLWN